MGIIPASVPPTKRLFDLVFSFVSLAILCPVILVLSVLVFFFEGVPIFFRQRRPGLNGKPFTLLKFRTMRANNNRHGKLLSDADRITGLGKFLRTTSLDELPELFNVLRGEMSLVGPRPLLMQYLDRYTPEQARRHEVLPGITGWAQINGRNALNWEDKFKFDVWYVDHWSFILDIRIILVTLWKVIKREGISQLGHTTAEEFLGSQRFGDS